MSCSVADAPAEIPAPPAARDDGEMPLFDKPELANVRDGLDAAHRDQAPLFDRFKVVRNGRTGDQHTVGQRVYSDGTEYHITKVVRGPPGAPPVWKKRWLYTAEGIKIAKDVLYPLHGEHSHSHTTGTEAATGAGSSTWVSYFQGEELVFKTGETAFACPAETGRIGLALTQNVVPGSSR